MNDAPSRGKTSDGKGEKKYCYKVQCYNCLGCGHTSVLCRKKMKNADARPVDNKMTGCICDNSSHMFKDCPKRITVSSENKDKNEKSELESVKGIFRDGNEG